MLRSFVLGAGGQYLLFSGGPVWLQLGTAFAIWRGRDTALVTRVALSPAMHSPALTDLPGTRPRLEWVPINQDHLCFLLLKLPLKSFSHPRSCHEPVPSAGPGPNALLRMLGSGVHTSSLSHARACRDAQHIASISSLGCEWLQNMVQTHSLRWFNF